MNGLRKCIAVDNHEAVKVGDVEKNMESKEVVKPKFTTDFPEVREGADVLTLRPDEEGSTAHVGDKRWDPPLVDEDWLARHLPGHQQGRRGAEWETMYDKYAGLHQAVKCQKSGENKKDKALWSLKEARGKWYRF